MTPAPAPIRTIDGCLVDTTRPVWRVRTPSETLCFSFAFPGAGEGFRASMRAACAVRLARETPERVHTGHKACGQLLGRVRAARGPGEIRHITLDDFWTYVRGLPADQVYRGRDLLGALRKLIATGFQGVDDGLREELPSLRVVVPPRASPARAMCPVKGALTESEMELLVRALHNGFEHGRVGIHDHALALLSVNVVPRPAQASQIKVGDLKAVEQPDGTVTHFLDVPRAKYRRGGAPRSRMTRRPIDPWLFAVLRRQADAAARWGVERGIPAGECPLFPTPVEAGRGPDWPDLPGLEGHTTGSRLSARLIRTLSGLEITSTCTGRAQHVTAARLRRTLATIARSRGASYRQIAKLLDHESEHTARLYTEPTVGMIARVEAAADLAPIAALFLGEQEVVSTLERSSAGARHGG